MSIRKIALITGSSRGIGKSIAEKLAQQDYLVIITGKSVNNNKNGDIYSVADNINKNYGEATAIPLDLRDASNIQKISELVKYDYGRLDLLVNNASAMWWANLSNTPAKKYDLINSVNSRGTYLISRALVPLMPTGSHIITHSPPLDYQSMGHYLNGGMKHMIGYMVSKLGMSLVASGLAQELRDKKIASNCIWPSTAIQSASMQDNNLISDKFNNPKLWRKPEIIADMVSELVKEPPEFTNNFLIDEAYLTTKGYRDFTKYQSVAGYEPPKLLELFRNKINY